MDITTLENWLWEAACSVRGPLDTPWYQDHILPLHFCRRPCDVFADPLVRLSEELARDLAEQDRTLSRLQVPDAVAERAPCSVLLVKRREPALLPWFRRAAKWVTRR